MLGKRQRSDNVLHIDGYYVHKSAVTITKDIVTTLLGQAKNKSRVIFNHSEKRARNDYKRKQSTINFKKLTHFKRELESFIHDNYSNKQPNTWNLIHSLPKCGSQAAHCDYVPDINISLSSDDNIPLIMMICLMPETKINIWPKSIRLSYIDETILQSLKHIKKETIMLDPGDILIFRGDLVHSGAEYEKENIRIHVYLDSINISRKRNQTWIISQHANESLKRIIKYD